MGIANSWGTAVSAVAATPTPALSFEEVTRVLGALLVALIATGVIVLAYRRGYWFSEPNRSSGTSGTSGDPSAGGSGQSLPTPAGPNSEGDSFVRSTLALWLVLGLLTLSVVSLAIDDATLRSTLVGGLTASAGGAIAFYFSNQAAAEARRDYLSASTQSMVVVPDVTGEEILAVKALFATLPGLILDVGTHPDTAKVKTQTPLGGTLVGRNTTVTVTSVE